MEKAQKGNAVVVAIIVIVAMAIASGVTYLAATRVKLPVQKAEVVVQPVAQPATSATQSNTAPVDNNQTASTTPSVFRDDTVTYGVPQEISGIKLFTGNDQSPYKIWEIGKLKTDGSKIYVAAIDSRSPAGIEIVRFIQTNPANKDIQLYLLSKYSSGGINDYVWNDKVMSGENNWTRIPSLEFPGIIAGPKGSTLKKEEDFPAGQLAIGERNDLDAIFFDNAKANLNLSQKIFYSDATLGDFFIGNDNGGLCVKAPDGTFKIYSMLVDLGGDVPKITWNNGAQNASKYSYKTEAGCGAADYIADVSAKISDKDLAQAGTASNGNVIYGYRDLNNKVLRDFYAEYQKLSNDENMSSRYYPDDKPKKMTYEEFLQTQPIFFWKDMFGRTIQFVNLHYIFTGGCGKPVIYLYPEQTTQVSVKVTPTAGMTVSDPAYGQGWNVSADPSSKLTDLSDGKTYPYLFWEGQGDSIYKMPTQGFVATRNNLEALLDEKLAKLGLIQKEISDFKEFWLPKMLAENKPYYFVTFVSRKDIDKLAPLDISPRPDTIIRVLMDYKGLDSWMQAPSFEIKTPERKGFAAVEWGGVLR